MERLFALGGWGGATRRTLVVVVRGLVWAVGERRLRMGLRADAVAVGSNLMSLASAGLGERQTLGAEKEIWLAVWVGCCLGAALARGDGTRQ
jgi:hypothetical protein